MDTFKISTCKDLLSDRDRELVKLCEEAGYKAVAVSVLDPEVKQSVHWSKRNVEFLTGEPDEKSKNKGRIEGWPAVWRIGDVMGVSVGCGNFQQRQLNHNHDLTKVSYRKTPEGWTVHGILKSMENNTSLVVARETGEHLENVKLILGKMRIVQALIAAEKRNEAFSEIVQNLTYWTDHVMRAYKHMKLDPKMDQPQLLALRNLAKLEEQLTKKKVYDRFNV